MSPKEFPFPKGEDASTNSSPDYRQPLQPVPLITHISDPAQQTVPVVSSPEPQPQPQQTVPAYRPESRRQFRAQPQLTHPALRSDSRQQPRGARQQSFVTAYSPASRQSQYLPDPPQTTRTPSPVRQPQYRSEPPQQTVRAISAEPPRQPIPTYRPESRERQQQHRRAESRQRGRARSPDPPQPSETTYNSAMHPAGQASMRTPSKAQSSNLFEQTASANIDRRFTETEQLLVEPQRRFFETERRPTEPGLRPIEPERRHIESERRFTNPERRSTDTQRRRTESVQSTPTKIIPDKRSSSRQGSARQSYRAVSSGTDSEDQHNRRLPRSRKPLTNTPRTESYNAVTDNEHDDEAALLSNSQPQPSTHRPSSRRLSSGSASDSGRGGRGKYRGLNFQDARTFMSSGRPVRAGDWDAGQPQPHPSSAIPNPTSNSNSLSPNSATSPPRLPLPIRTSRPPTPPLPFTPVSTEKMNNRIGWALFLNSSIKNHLVAFLGELIGTTMFLFFAFAGTVVANVNSPSDLNLTTTGLTTGWNVTKLLYVAFSFGFSLMVNVWIFFRISGGLFNPAVTLALLLTGAIGFVRALFLFVAQILGAIAASGLIIGLFPAPANVRTTLSKGLSIPKGLFIEAFLTAELVFTILMLAKEKHKATFIAPVGIGLALFIAELVGVYWTGGSLNPARSIGPSIVTWTWDHEHWIYWVGPLIGSLLAVGFYALIKALEYELANPGQDSDAADSPSPERTVQTRQDQVRRRLMDAMGYDVINHRGSVEYENLGKSELGLMKPGIVYSREGLGGRDVVGDRASAYVAGHGRSGSGVYPAGGGFGPHVGPMGTAIRASGEVAPGEGLTARDMEYERKQHGSGRGK